MKIIHSVRFGSINSNSHIREVGIIGMVTSILRSLLTLGDDISSLSVIINFKTFIQKQMKLHYVNDGGYSSRV